MLKWNWKARCSALVVGLLLTACGYRGPQTAEVLQGQIAETQLPAAFELPGPAQAQVRTFRARAWVDARYRRRASWQAQLEAQLDRVNAYLGPAFGATLEVELRDWEGDQAQGEAGLETALAGLERIDAGDDVDWVIGFVGPPPGASSAFTHLGVARPLGKHLVVRDMNDGAEFNAVERAFDELPQARRRHLYVARKRHKETAVLLHELAHTLGSLHESGDGFVMRPGYSPQVARFSPATAKMIGLGLELRSLRGNDAASAAARGEQRGAMLDLALEADAAWDAGERDDLIAQLAVGLPVDSGADITPTMLDPDEVTIWRRALSLWASGQRAQAWALLAPLVRRHADEPMLQWAGCALAAAGVAAPAALQACDQAARLSPSSARPFYLAARAHDRAGRTREAILSLDAVAARRLHGATDVSRADLVIAFHAAGAITRAELAAQRDGDWPTVLRVSRRWLGLPPDAERFGVSIDEEPDYVARVHEIDAITADGELVAAAGLVDEALAAYPDAPGLLARACRLMADAGHFATARKYCDDALVGWEETALAHQYIAYTTRNRSVAIAHLERAIELTPDSPVLWLVLAERYRLSSRDGDRQRLAAAYLVRFGRRMPGQPAR